MRKRIDNSSVAPEKIRLPFIILVCLQASLYCMLRFEFATPTVVECHGLAKETLRERLKQLLAFLGSLGSCKRTEVQPSELPLLRKEIIRFYTLKIITTTSQI